MILTNVLIPSRSGLLSNLRRASGVGLEGRLNPFSIRSAFKRITVPESLLQPRLNPFSIRSAFKPLPPQAPRIQPLATAVAKIQAHAPS